MKPSLIVIGLGNPGKQYEGTRHNVGFWATDELANEFGTEDWQDKQKFMSLTSEGRIITAPILFVKPTTFMNRSGETVKKLIDFFKLDPSKQILVITDDVDLEVGDIRFRESGGAGSHNGLKSIVEQFGENFPRLRVGIRGSHAPEGSFLQAGEDLASYVLSKPSKDDQEKIREALSTIPETVKKFVMEDSQ